MIRMAGKALEALGKTGKWLVGDATKTDLAIRLGMDAMGGFAVGATTPGDLGDKIIAGMTDAGMASVGGLAAGRIGGKNQVLGTMLDMAGSYGGAYAAMPVSEKLLQGKDLVMGGQGETPWQRMSREQQQEFASRMEQEILAKYGLLLPGAGYNAGMANVANVGVYGNGIA